MSIVTIATNKGGTGKTTTCAHVGHALAMSGKRVLLVDVDPQGNLGEVLGVPSQELDQEISAVLESKVSLREIINEVRPNLFLAPANLRLSYLEPWLITSMRREDRLKQALASIDGEYDITLIDSPPSLGILTINALAAADHVLIPMATEYLSLLGVALLLQTIENMRMQLNPRLQVLGVVATRVTRTSNAREVLETVRGQLPAGVRLLDAAIPERTAAKEAAGLGKTVMEHAPDSPVATAYAELAEEVLRYGQ
jgi:chromosome partitioning protein